MSWRVVVIGHNAKLDYQMGYLVVRSQDVLRISLSEIGLLIIESTAVSLTSYLLNEMTKKKIKVIFCDEKKKSIFGISAFALWNRRWISFFRHISTLRMTLIQEVLNNHPFCFLFRHSKSPQLDQLLIIDPSDRSFVDNSRIHMLRIDLRN